MPRPRAPQRDKRLLVQFVKQLVQVSFGGSYEALAEAIGVSVKTIYNWTNLGNNKVPEIETLQKLIDADARGRRRTRDVIERRWHAAVECRADAEDEVYSTTTELQSFFHAPSPSTARLWWGGSNRLSQSALVHEFNEVLSREQPKPVVFFVWRWMESETLARLSSLEMRDYAASILPRAHMYCFLHDLDESNKQDVIDAFSELGGAQAGSTGAPALFCPEDDKGLSFPLEGFDIWGVYVPYDGVQGAWLVSSVDPYLERVAAEWGVDSPLRWATAVMRLNQAQRNSLLSLTGLAAENWESRLRNWTVLVGNKDY